MGSDRARLRADVTQRYRRPVFQQGRVTLEADLNEAHQWIGEELEAETLDIVGPCGTPDDGYLLVETVGTQEWTFDRAEALTRIGAAYGPDAAAEIAPLLP